MALEQALRRLQLQQPDEAPTCPYCASDPAHLRLEACGHPYCAACLPACLRASLDDGRYPSCAHQGCHRSFAAGDAELALQVVAEKDSVAAAEQLQQRYHRVSVLAALQAEGAERVECLHCGLELSMDSGQRLPAGYRCRGCGLEPQLCAAASDADYLESNTVRCSGAGCGIHIQKHGGCNHLTCTRCAAHTCWACGQALDAHGAHSPGGLPCSGQRPDSS